MYRPLLVKNQLPQPPQADGVRMKDTMQCLKFKSHLLFVLESIHLKLNPLCTVQFITPLHLFLLNHHLLSLSSYALIHPLTHTCIHTHLKQPVTPAEAYSGNLKRELYCTSLLSHISHSKAAADLREATAPATVRMKRGDHISPCNVAPFKACLLESSDTRT